MPHDAQRLFLQYVTGELSAAERDDFEQMLLTDGAFSVAMEEAEFTLLEQYAAGELDSELRAAVDRWLTLSPVHRRQVAITRALRSSTQPLRRTARWTLWWAAAATVAVSVVAGVLLLTRPHRATTPAAQQSVAANYMPPRPQTRASQPFQGDTILLRAQRLRGAETEATPAYNTRPGRPTRLQILVAASAGSGPYSLDLKRDGGASYSRMHFDQLPLTTLRADGAADLAYVEVVLPQTLPAGQYRGLLRAPSGSYQLRFEVRSYSEGK